MEGFKLLAYADDVVIVVVGRTETELMRKADKTIQDIPEWVEYHKLMIASEKTEAVMMFGRKRIGELTGLIPLELIAEEKRVCHMNRVTERKRKGPTP